MIYKNVIAFLSVILMLLSIACATEEETGEDKGKSANYDNNRQVQIIIDEYKAYISKIPPALREEIVTYRKEIAKINKQKRALYHSLSQEAQHYLSKEQEYKKRLPMPQKKLINLDNES